MTLRDHSCSSDQGLSTLSLLIADYIIGASDEGRSLHEIEAEFDTRYAQDKVRSLIRHGFVIGDDRGQLVMVHDPRMRAAA
jgi:hypothetical protein